MPSQRKTLYVAVSDGSQDSAAAVADVAPLTYLVQTVAPTTGATVAVTSGRNIILIVNPAGTIATLTINMASTPTDGDQVTVASTQIVTALTMGNGTFVGALTRLAVAGFATYIYHSSIGKWLRIG
jgi:hypothetical protein